MPWLRRALLHATGVLAASAASGCLFGGGCGRIAGVTLSRATDERLIEEFSDPISVGSLGPVGERIAASATRTGNATYEAGDVAFEDGTYRRAGTFYELTTTSVGSRPAVGFEADIEVDFEPTGTPGGPVVAFEDLPAADRRALLGTFLNSVAGRVVGPSTPSGSVSGPGRLLYPENATGESVLVPDPEYGAITYRGGRLTLSVGERVPDAELRTYRVESVRLAESREAFVRQARNRVESDGVVLDSDSLTADQRDLLDTARDDEYGYSECIDDGGSEALRDVTARVFGVEWPDPMSGPPGPREAFVRYDGAWYSATFGISVA